MSRSRRKNKIFGNHASSDKYDKRKSNRKMRRLLKEKFDEDGVTPDKRDFSNVWSFSKDGKSWWDDASDKDMSK